MPSLYVGIDVGKSSHVAALLTPSAKNYRSCPTISIEQSRAGFAQLLAEIEKHRPDAVYCLLERTGHYGQALEQFLTEAGIVLYHVMSQTKYGKNKSDRHDARALAAMLYTQIGLNAPVTNEREQIRQYVPASPITSMLARYTHHRYDLSNESTQRKNRLISICDELFPEFTQVFKDPNKPTALSIRERFPTPAHIADAELDQLLSLWTSKVPGREALTHLQKLAATTIGTANPARRHGLVTEQKQLIAELRLLQRHIDELDKEIAVVLATSREGQIVSSLPGMGLINAATLVAGIGSIANFESPAKLRAYVGWSPRQSQTGKSYDSMHQDRGGNHLLKRAMYIAALVAIRHEPWRSHYTRLVERKCPLDERTGRRRGKMKVIGRIAGQMIGVIYTLLKRDHDLLSRLTPGETPPAPELYDAEKHAIELKRVRRTHVQTSMMQSLTQ